MNSECCSRCQAEHMANDSKIDDLSEAQIREYITERVKMPTGKKGEENPPSCGLPDLWLFPSILNKEQLAIFREKHPDMFTDGNLVNF